MCFSNVTLFYGLWVTTASLNFAATAHSASRPTILAIDLIISRRRRGKLVMKQQDGKTTASELPEEVWEMVKDELLGIEVRQAELDTLDDLRCENCANRDQGASDCTCEGCNLLPEQREQLEDGHMWSRWGDPSCPLEEYGCMWNVEDSGITHMRSAEQFASISKLLSLHGLALATAEMWHEDPGRAYEDWEALSAIALPLQASNGSTKTLPLAHADSCHQVEASRTTNSVLELPPQALILPFNADRRFARLVSKYRLHVVDRTKSTIIPVNQIEETSTAPVQPATTGAKSKGEKGSAKEGDQPPPLFAVEEPRWMLYTISEGCC